MPAASKMLRVPTCVSPQVISCTRLGDHRVGLEGASATLACEVDRRGRQHPTHPAPPIAGTGREAGHGPDGGVGGVLASGRELRALPRQVPVRGPRLDRAPADRFAVEVGEEAARRRRAREAAVGLGPQALLSDRDRRLAPRIRSELEALALAGRRVAAHAEDGLDVLPARLVGRHDREVGGREVGRAQAGGQP